jgi:endo-1,4-beta-xylanase
MRAEKFFGCLPTLAIALSIAIGCRPPPQHPHVDSGESNDSGGSNGSGGTSEQGGSPGTGGMTGEGGILGQGGTMDKDAGASGGVTGSGGSGTGGQIPTVCGVSSTWGWSSTDSLMNPVTDGSHTDLKGIKSPTVVSYNNKYHLYATVVDSKGKSTLQYISFGDWPASGSATVYFLDNNASFSGSYAAPHLFYFTSQKKWYLISQSNGPYYSTTSDPGQPSGWSKPATMFSSTPSIVTQNAGSGVGWSDFWVICDGSNCHLFFGNENGVIFRSQTSTGSFPSGFGTPVIVMQNSTSGSTLFGGVSVYKLKGSTKFLLLVESVGSNGHYFRSWTADKLDGTWTSLAETETTPFAGASNVSFSSSKWTKDFGSGEAVRSSYDETMTLDPCNVRYVYQGHDPYTSATGNSTPWKLGLLSRTN